MNTPAITGQGASRFAQMAENLNKVLLQGDLSGLSALEKTQYYNKVCETVGLNPLTKPFDYIKFQGKEVLYANKNCAEQLRMIHGIGIEILSREITEGLLIVKAKASTNGRIDESIGVLVIAGLKGIDLANAMMKCETKAKRRVTLSICGLGMLDESEIEYAQKSESEVERKAFAIETQQAAPKPMFQYNLTGCERKDDAAKLLASAGAITTDDEYRLYWESPSEVKPLAKYLIQQGAA